MNKSVQVYWESENEWFQGKIDEIDESKGYHVLYLDGDEEWIPLNQINNRDVIQILDDDEEEEFAEENKKENKDEIRDEVLENSPSARAITKSEITEDLIRVFASSIGINADTESELLGVARRALLNLPEEWVICVGEGTLLYFTSFSFTSLISMRLIR